MPRGLMSSVLINEMRVRFLFAAPSAAKTKAEFSASCSTHQQRKIDTRDAGAIDALFSSLNRNVEVIIHTAAQPSHEWAAREPHIVEDNRIGNHIWWVSGDSKFKSHFPDWSHKLVKGALRG